MVAKTTQRPIVHEIARALTGLTFSTSDYEVFLDESRHDSGVKVHSRATGDVSVRPGDRYYIRGTD